MNIKLFSLIIFSLSFMATGQELGAPPVPHEINNLPSAGKKVALTFDACSTRMPSHYDQNVTEVLLQTQTPATIFVGGRWVREEKEHAKALAANPLFELGNHTWDHPHLIKMTDAIVIDEIKKTQDILFKTTGKKATLFRAPYCELEPRIVKIAADLGLTTIQYDVASGDPDQNMTKEKLVKWVIKKAKGGSIIVMHINQRGWHTAEALPEIIAQLRAKGFELVKVSDLLKSAIH